MPIESILKDDEQRYVMFPIKDRAIWEMYKKQVDFFFIWLISADLCFLYMKLDLSRYIPYPSTFQLRDKVKGWYSTVHRLRIWLTPQTGVSALR